MATEDLIRVRDWDERDSDFYQAVVHRIIPERTASPRDMAAVGCFMDQVVADAGSRPGGVETYVAVDAGDRPLGLFAIRLDFDHFTNHPRACVEVLVVSDAAEGKGVGRALMRHAEAWGREHGCREVVLDVFADNEAAIAFYRRVGYQPDHLRMTKSLVGDADPD